MTAKLYTTTYVIHLTATSRREASPSGASVWVDDQGFVYCEVGAEAGSPWDIRVDEPYATRLRIGQELARLRTAKDITQYQLATMAGVKPSTIMALEQGRYTTSLDKVDAIAQLIGCHLTVVRND